MVPSSDADGVNSTNPHSGILGRRQTRRSSNTRARLVDAAAQLLATLGYEGTTLDAVAEVAGLTKGTVYYHFD